ncbi:MAG: sodium:proton antiporter [Bacteroidales bacterium]|nr:sodium:proton antiporter [Candidatus Cryptobacteroides caccocaballi]
MNELNDKSPRTPHWSVALIPLAFMVVVLSLVIRFFKTGALDGGSQVALLLTSGLVIAIGMFIYDIPWKSFEDAIAANIGSVATSLLILLMIGAVAGTWMVSGVVPTLIYYGLHVISPKIFLFACCAIAALVALMTGSSWTTIATIGVALIGIGDALGFSPGWTAGAIISGAYFGDKISPLSDTTVLASSAAGIDLFTHIRYMLGTTVPSISIALIVFLLVSIFHSSASAIDIDSYCASLESTFNISLWLMVVPVITVVMIIKKVPAVLTLMISALTAGVTALIAQPGIVAGIAGSDVLDFTSGFKGIMVTIYGQTAVSTGNPELDELVMTNGMTGMLPTIYLIISAIVFGATMVGSGMLRSLTEALTRKITGRFGTVTATVFTGIFNNMAVGDQYLSIILTCSLYKDLYDKNGLEGRLLSRAAEDSATVTSVLIPWNSCGMTQATVLRVATIEYLPYCLFNILSPFMSMFIAAIGYKIIQKEVRR